MAVGLRAINGTVSSPAFSFANDTDCGLYLIGADNFGVATNGAKVLEFTSTGTEFAKLATFAASAILNNAIFLRGKKSGGTLMDLIGVLAGGNIVIGGSAPTGTAIYLGDSAVDSDPVYLRVGGASRQVLVGANDSGGAGYKMLRVVNS